MSNPSRYWELFVLLPSGYGCGYKVRVLAPAQDFFYQEFPTLADRANIIDKFVQNRLFNLLVTSDLVAELCLRCYISYFILRSCIRRAKSFSAGGRINYRDLLPLVLNDDGKIPRGDYVPFSIDILYSFSSEHQYTLASWVDLKVKHNKELNKFLLQFDLEIRSNWAILNKAAKSHLDDQRDKEVLTVYHAVYRWEIPQHHRRKLGGKCPEPTQLQLEAMIRRLRKQSININSCNEMLSELERIARMLRQQSIWGQTGHPVTSSLDEIDDTKGYLTNVDAATFEQLELREFFHEQLFECLNKAIIQVIEAHVSKQSKSRGYATNAHLIRPILKLIYESGKSQTEIGKELGISQLKVSRLVNPTNLIISTRRKTLEMLLNNLLEKAKQMDSIQLPLEPDYFDSLLQLLEEYLDKEIFHEALAELRTSRNTMNSLYAQRLCFVLNM